MIANLIEFLALCGFELPNQESIQIQLTKRIWPSTFAVDASQGSFLSATYGTIFILRMDIGVEGEVSENGNFSLLYVLKMFLYK